MKTLVERAAEFAYAAHYDHIRKYSGEPYFVHLEEVAQIVSTVTDDQEVIAAAYLHDTLEDTNTNMTKLLANFPFRVAFYVWECTEKSRKTDGNRQARKEIDRNHYAQATPEGQTIKLADLISNTKSIVAEDKDFAKVYLKEKEALLKVLNRGDRHLHKIATENMIEGKRQLEIEALEKKLEKMYLNSCY